MAEMNLFDVDLEDDPRPRPENCCDALGGMARLEQFLHVLGHSRVPFSVDAVAELVGANRVAVLDALITACQNGVIGVVEPENYMAQPPGLYVGQLPKRR